MLQKEGSHKHIASVVYGTKKPTMGLLINNKLATHCRLIERRIL